MAPPAKTLSSAACTLAIDDRASTETSIDAAMSEAFFMTEYLCMVTSI